MNAPINKGDRGKDARKDHLVCPPTKLRKLTYVLPSGRKLKIVLDNESELVGSAVCTS